MTNEESMLLVRIDERVHAMDRRVARLEIAIISVLIGGGGIVIQQVLTGSGVVP